MKKDSKPQYASIEQPFGCEPPIVYCPICGKATIEPSDDGPQITPCKHLAFIFVGELEDFEYKSEDFEKKIAEEKPTDLTLKKLKKQLHELGYDSKLLALEITYSGMSCGPVWSTDVYGFDYDKIRKD